MAGRKATLGLAMALLSMTVATGCDEGVETIGPEGGVVVSPDGRVTLEIPPGALDQEVLVTIGEVDDGPDGSIGRVYEVEPRLTMLARPARLTYDLLAPEVEGTEALGLADAQMEDVALVTEKDTQWDRLADRDVDLDEATVSASVLFFSTYAVVVE